MRERLLVFVAGGMTYSEMRTAYIRADALKRDVLIGSTHPVTPQAFMDDLKVLELGGVGSRTNPNGVVAQPVGSTQAYYDQRYWQPEPVVPPPRAMSAPAAEQKSRLGLFSPPPTLAPSQSMTSVASADTGSSVTEKLKKKRGFFRF